MNRPDWPEWKVAMDEELALMAKYNVWDEVDKPEDTNIIGCRWVFRIKRDSNGKVLKYRARLVAQGFTQLYGIDFQETFAPVARLSSIRTAIALAASEDWELHQMDVKSAYLNSPIDSTPRLLLRSEMVSATRSCCGSVDHCDPALELASLESGVHVVPAPALLGQGLRGLRRLLPIWPATFMPGFRMYRK